MITRDDPRYQIFEPLPQLPLPWLAEADNATTATLFKIAKPPPTTPLPCNRYSTTATPQLHYSLSACDGGQRWYESAYDGFGRANWPLSYLVSKYTHQIWSQSAEPFLSYSLAANFDTSHAARATCQGEPPNEPIPTVINKA